MRKVAIAAILTAGLLASYGCKSDQGQSASTQPAATQPAPTPSAAGSVFRDFVVRPVDANTLGYNSTWTIDIAILRNQRIRSVNILDDIIVTIEEPEFMVTAVSARDGTVLWKRMLTSNVTETIEARRRDPAKDSTIYITTPNKLWGLAAKDGKLVTLSNLAFPVNEPPVPFDEKFMFGSLHGRVYAHDVQTGYHRWVYRLPAGILTSPIIVNNNTVFCVDGKGEWVLLNAEDGTPLWRGRAAERVSADPVTNDNSIFIASEDQNLYCISRSTGADRWKYRTNGKLTKSPILFGNSLYQPLANGDLASIDITNGKEFWQVKGNQVPFALADTKLFVQNGTSVSVIDNLTGQELTRFATTPLQTVLPTKSGQLLFVSKAGRLQMLTKQ